MKSDVRWRPFQLDDGLPKGKGVDKMEHYGSKFGAQKVREMIPNMKQVGESVGINFSYGGSIGNTEDSHRLIWKARQVGGSELQDKMVESLFKAYFEDEQSLGELTVLKQCAERAGMPTDITDALLQDSCTDGKKEIQQEKKEFASKWNCRGVPLFVIDNKYPLSGAQPMEQFLEIFEELDE